MSESSTPTVGGVDRDSLLMVVAAAALLLVFLYSVLVVQQILAFVAVSLWLFVVYLLWRFVRAHERLAAAAERVADRRPGTGDDEHHVSPAEQPTDPRESGESTDSDGSDEADEPTGSPSEE